ncbi:MAG: hypothetical protein ACXWCC_17840, partial [Caldimonas sp.]
SRSIGIVPWRASAAARAVVVMADPAGRSSMLHSIDRGAKCAFYFVRCTFILRKFVAPLI